MLDVNVTKRREAFRLDVAFSMPTRGVVALFGRSGCGKSTVVNLIAGLLAPDAGRIVLGDTLLCDKQRRIEVPVERRRIGYVFQDARLFPHLRVLGNLRYAQRRAGGTPYVTLDRVVGLLGLDVLLHRRVHALSGGERQRVAIGRALLSQPRLLLLDEPLAALDQARRDEVLPYLEALRDDLGIPMVYVTHRYDEVLRLATHLVLMEAGAVIAQGDIARMSLEPQLRALIGPDEVGAVVEGVALSTEVAGLTRVRVGQGEIQVAALAAAEGTALRVHFLARDIVIATQPPEHLSIRSSLAGVVTEIQADTADTDLITLDIGAAHVVARITRAATRELALVRGKRVWALIKAASLRGHARAAPTSGASPHA